MLSSHRSASASLLLLGSFVGCSGEVENASDRTALGGASGGQLSTGGASNQPGGNGTTTTGGAQGDPIIVSGCPGSVCCVPLAFSAANINVYKMGDGAGVTLVVEHVRTANPDYVWKASATVKTSFGGTQNCDTGGLQPASTRYAAIQCPTVQSAVTCGSNVNVEVNFQASGFASELDPTPTCDGGLGMTLTYTVPVECPICPDSPISVNFQPCDMPSDSACSYMALSYGGQMFPAPCYCAVDSTTGQRKWQCAIG